MLTCCFGHSDGGFFALEAALKLPIAKLALYEPAVSINGSLPLDWFPSFEQALHRNDSVLAIAIFLKGLRLHWLCKLPIWLISLFARVFLRQDEGREMVELLPTMVWEIKEIQRQDLNYERYQTISAETLLLGGTHSPVYLLYALRTLVKTIPHVRLIELPKLDHNAPDQNAPAVVADKLKQFFA